MTQHDLDALLYKWQARLRLLDWDIKAKFVPLNELDHETEAHIAYDIYHSEAVISLLHPEQADLLGQKLHEYDVDFSLVHELVHLRLADVSDPESGISEHEERAVNMIARAFVEADRRILELDAQVHDLSNQKSRRK